MGWTKSSGPAGEVGFVEVLKSQPESKRAEEILNKTASLVKPIMKKHGWYLPLLCEFFPENPNLLGVNVNGGERICIRLRPQHDPHSFLPLEESLIGTMLHELTHNERGPHDDTFFKILDGLQDEYDALRASGYSGEGFLGKGSRVGQGVSHDTMDPKEAREKALKKLEERERVRRLLGKGGKLGGAAPDTKGKRRGDILADAAERRLRATKSCGGDDAHQHPSGSRKEDLPADVQADIDRAEKDSRRVVIDLTALDSDEEGEAVLAGPSTSGSGRVKAEPVDDVPATKRKRTSAPSSDDVEVLPSGRSLSSASRLLNPPSRFTTPLQRPSSRSAPTASSSSTTSSRPSSAAPRPSASSSRPSQTQPLSRRLTPQAAWTCPTCTYANASPFSLACEVCLTERPAGTIVVGADVGPSRGRTPVGGAGKVVKDGWACESCSTRNEHVFWTCKVCGRMKRSSERG
ncbi:hypothetical protein JCM6882_001798 [Rhodosporidiobolus microsporus]